MNAVLEKRIEHSCCPWCGSEDIHFHFKTFDRSGSGETFPIHTCKSCSFCFTQEVPSPETIGPYYDFEEYISHSDTTKTLTDRIYHWVRNQMLNRKFKLLVKHCITPGKSILDFGSGTGYFLNHVKQKGWQTKGIEINDEARKYAQQQFDLEILAPDKFEQIDQQFDAITLWHVLEHLYDFKTKLEQFHHKLVDQGLLILALPNHRSWDAKFLGKDWAAYDTPRHLWHFTPTVIEKMANANNFELVKYYPMPFDAFYVSMLSYQLKNAPLSSLRGGIVGLISNINCTFDRSKGSSIIYILRKQ